MSNTIQIVHVDDDPDILSIARMSLEVVGGFDVVQFSSAQSLLENLTGLNPDLLLLDVMMPDMDGLELLQELRKLDLYEDIPAVFMTAKADPAFKDTLTGFPGVDWITKPFDPITLPEQLTAILGKQ
ncbi:response regulator [Ruegeria lacuscaerulensis]|uniref:response regulator n=1 Tax=Ruegeria lacuscaerulensis TaxID=55218 RepID=UPI00147A8185|nr:response regulator [Ruegeria lacuscaerulensis]